MNYELSEIDYDILDVLYFVEPFEKILEEVAAPPKIVADCLKHLIAKKYVVAHSYSSTPVYNKVIDTGPGTGNTNTDDFTVQFIDSAFGATGTSCKCLLTAVGSDQNIGYTVQVGHDSTNALTFTAAS